MNLKMDLYRQSRLIVMNHGEVKIQEVMGFDR